MNLARIRYAEGDKTPIDRKLFGSFIEHIENCIDGGICDPSDGHVRADVMRLCRELGPSILRFPGGTVMGVYHWEDHIGPVEQRKKKRNLVWGGMLTREFGTCEFIEYCRSIGAEPMICVNMPTGSAEEAANWVEFCNGEPGTYYADLRCRCGYEEPFHVKYWCVGNESYAVPDLGRQHDVKEYIGEAWEYAKYMKMTDPAIELVFVGGDEQWNRAVLDSLGPVCDYLSVHFYTGEADCFEQTDRFASGALGDTIALIGRYNAAPVQLNKWYRIPPRAHDIKIALDEWNIWSAAADGSSPYGLSMKYSWKDALWTAYFLNMMIRRCDTISIANLAQMVNVIAPVMAGPDGAWKQTTFYPFARYSAECGSAYVPTVCDNGAIDAVCTETAGGHVFFVLNRGPEPAGVILPERVSGITVLTAGSPDAVNTPDADHVKVTGTVPEGEAPVLPAYSIGIVRTE